MEIRLMSDNYKVKPRPLMKCGHTAQGVDEKGRPVCAICAGIKEGWNEIEVNKPSLAGRTARCLCGREVPSSYNLPFFEYQENKGQDRYYCGCRGWD